MRRFLPIFLAVSAGCSNVDPGDTEAMKARISELEVEIIGLKSSVAVLEIQMRSKAEQATSAELVVGQAEFAAVNTWMGAMTFQATDVAQVGAGSRVSLKIGNPTSADIPNLKLYVSYGAAPPKEVGKWADWRESLQSIEHTSNSAISAASWTTIPVMLPGVKSDELGFLEVRPEVTRIALRTK